MPQQFQLGVNQGGRTAKSAQMGFAQPSDHTDRRPN